MKNRTRRSWTSALAGTAALTASLSGALTSAVALADTSATVATPSANSSVASTSESSLKKVLSRMKLIYAGQYAGPGLGRMTDPLQPDDYGRTKEADSINQQFFDHVIVTSYKVNDSGLSVGMGIGGTNYSYGKGFIYNDPSLRISHSSLFKNGNFTFSGDLRSYLPVSKGAHDANRINRLRSVSTANYDIPNSKFSFYTLHDVNYYIYGSTGSAKAKDFAVMIQPTLNYQALSNFGAYIGYELDAIHTKNLVATDWLNDGTYLYLGASWDVTSKLNLSPYLSLRPGGAINMDSTQLAGYVTYKFL
jgi:hypothetical protein